MPIGEVMTFSTFTAFAVAVIFFGGSVALLRHFPVPENKQAEGTLQELALRYSKWRLPFAAVQIGVMAVGTVAVWAVLIALETFHAITLPHATFIFRPMAIIWFLPSFVVGSLVTERPTILMLRRLLGWRWSEFERYEMLRTRPLSSPALNRVARSVMAALIAGAAFYVLLIMDWYVRVTPEEFAINGILSVKETRYPLERIQRIQTAPKLIAPNGNIVTRREYLITFADGSVWTTNFCPKDLNENEKHNFVTHISGWAGKPIEEVALFKLDGFTPKLIEEPVPTGSKMQSAEDGKSGP